MKEHIFFPKPRFQRHICFPDFIGGYNEYPEHRVNREYATRENHLDRYYNLHIVLDGKGALYYEGKTFELAKGQGFLYGPGLRQTYQSDESEPWDIRWVHFYGGGLEEFLDGKGLDEPWLFRLADMVPFDNSIERLLQLGRTYKVDDEFEVAAALYELLIRLQLSASQLNIPANQTDEKIRTAANYVRAHCKDRLSLEQAAAIAGYSTHYFSRKFNQLFGISFSDFVLESRLLRAKQLLSSTNLSIKRISMETGFSQSSYFGKCFRAFAGMTPLEFRDIHKAYGSSANGSFIPEE
ncbi:helix-turn-helix domain-containing protein ['Paenibacillus yunnanensis' Narsing Rao et al. 2020]|uniref:helix-turn-helix domain-containing protein n=1 Tax=Paenibacillus tengchongensis TaxID=2608684 RepID=UPI00124BD0A1|nr:AraC family transcriptional regulator [Paenibacillus tengchongensis]